MSEQTDSQQTSPRHLAIADLLMGAAMADGTLDGLEIAEVERVLVRLMGVPELPPELRNHLDRFSPTTFSIAAAVEKLQAPTMVAKHKLLELVVAIHDSDDMWDLDEDAYLRSVAQSLGMAEEDYADLTVGDIAFDAIGDELLPPPLPSTS